MPPPSDAPTDLPGADLVAFLPTSDVARARAFFVDTLGLRALSENEFALVIDAHGSQVRVTPVGAFEPHRFTALGWEVADVGATARSLAAAGVDVLRFESMVQDADGVWTAPDGSTVAWFNDPDGNVLSVSHHG